MAYKNDGAYRNPARKKRITKKMASEICKKVVGTDKGLYKVQDTVRDRWELRTGMITVSLAYESLYNTFSKTMDGNYIEVQVTVNGSDMTYIFFDPESLEKNSEYTFEWNCRNKERFGTELE